MSICPFPQKTIEGPTNLRRVEEIFYLTPKPPYVIICSEDEIFIGSLISYFNGITKQKNVRNWGRGKNQKGKKQPDDMVTRFFSKKKKKIGGYFSEIMCRKTKLDLALYAVWTRWENIQLVAGLGQKCGDH